MQYYFKKFKNYSKYLFSGLYKYRSPTRKSLTQTQTKTYLKKNF